MQNMKQVPISLRTSMSASSLSITSTVRAPCSIGQRSYHFRPSTFALIPAGFKHDENHQPSPEVLFVGFHCGNPVINSLSGVFDDDKEHTVLQTLQRMSAEFKRKRDGFSELLNLQMSEITVYLQRLLSASDFHSPAEDQMQYVLNYMNEHYRHKLSVASLAEMSGYSYDRFRHLFKERFMHSPHRYLLLKRLDYAKSLLLHSQMHILRSRLQPDSSTTPSSAICSNGRSASPRAPSAFRAESYRE